MHAWAKYLLLGGLYFSQGLPFGFFTQALPTWLAQQGASPQKVGLSTLLALPWATKLLWSPLIDRYQHGPWGPRKTWIVGLQAGAVLLLLALAGLDPTLLGPLLAAVLLTNLLAATQDIATDALAVDLLEPHERGVGNGIQAGAYRVGMVLGGGGLLMGFATLRWAGTMAVMAAALALATLPLLRYREPPALPHAGGARAALRPLLRRWLATPALRGWLGLLVLGKAGESAGSTMIKPFLVQRGLGLAEIGWLMGTLGFGAALCGALLGGGLTRVLGGKHGLLLCVALQSLGLLVWVAPALGWPQLSVEVAVVTEHLTSGMTTASLFSAMMDHTGREQAASEYTLQASAVVVGQGLGAALSGFVVANAGYPLHFGLCAAVSALFGVWLWLRPPPGFAQTDD